VPQLKTVYPQSEKVTKEGPIKKNDSIKVKKMANFALIKNSNFKEGRVNGKKKIKVPENKHLPVGSKLENFRKASPGSVFRIRDIFIPDPTDFHSGS
jgi:hypothetical protein